jgi:ABC-type oligopeptide transport system ATPase subunit
MGPNGSGKTTLFELITGSIRPSSGHVLCCGKNIHRVRHDERDRLAIHYHQAYQVRRFARTWPSFLFERAGSGYPMIHLSTSRSSTPRTATSASCSTSSASYGGKAGSCFYASTPRSATISRSCARSARAGSSSSPARSLSPPDFATLARDDRFRAYLGDLAPGG